jgi:hypothetical protein
MISKFALWLLGHPILSLFAIVCTALGISRWVQTCAGDSGLIRGKKISLVAFLVCLLLLLLDGVAAWYARKLNPDGYGLLYPIAVALLLFPVGVICAILALVFTLTSRRAAGKERT